MAATADQTTALTRTDARVGLMRPIASPDQVIEAQNAVRDYVAKTLQAGRDYGEITSGGKPTLLKPGAERVCNGFGLAERFEVVEKEIDHDRRIEWSKRKKVGWNKAANRPLYEEESGVSLGLYRYVVRCVLVHRETGQEIGDALGAASTMESKYIDRPRDLENTVLKMACKRAFVAATLLAVGLSDQFTQDLEDGAAVDGDGEKAAGTGGGDADFEMPFGKTKGARLRDLDDGEIRGAMKWAEEKGKFAEFCAAAARYLRRDPVATSPAASAPVAGAAALSQSHDEIADAIIANLDTARLVMEVEKIRPRIVDLPKGTAARARAAVAYKNAKERAEQAAKAPAVDDDLPAVGVAS